MATAITITGEMEINGAILRFERDVLPAELRKGTRDAAKLVMAEYRARVPVRSGAMRDAVVVRATKRSRTRIGHSIKIDRNKLFAAYEKRTGKPPGKRKEDSEPFFYPAVVELGDQTSQAQRPLRGALYDNERPVKQEFAQSLVRAVNHPKVKAKKL